MGKSNGDKKAEHQPSTNEKKIVHLQDLKYMLDAGEPLQAWRGIIWDSVQSQRE